MKRRREVELRVAAGLLAALAVIMGVGPLLALTLYQPAPIPAWNHHRSAGLVVNPTGSTDMQAEADFVISKLNTYEASNYGNAIPLYSTSATTQMFCYYANLGLRYYHFVGVGQLASNTPQLQFYDPANTGQTKWMAPFDLRGATQQNSMYYTKQVVLSCCYGMANWNVQSYLTSFAWVFVSYLGAETAVGATGTLDDYAAYKFTEFFYDYIFDSSLADNLNMAFLYACRDVEHYLGDLFDVAWTVISALNGAWLGLAVDILVGAIIGALILAEYLTAGAATLLIPLLIGVVAGIVTGILSYQSGAVLKAQYLSAFGIYGLVLKLRPIGAVPPGDPEGGSGGGGVPPGGGDDGGGGKPGTGPGDPTDPVT